MWLRLHLGIIFGAVLARTVLAAKTALADQVAAPAEIEIEWPDNGSFFSAQVFKPRYFHAATAPWPYRTVKLLLPRNDLESQQTNFSQSASESETSSPSGSDLLQIPRDQKASNVVPNVADRTFIQEQSEGTVKVDKNSKPQLSKELSKTTRSQSTSHEDYPDNFLHKVNPRIKYSQRTHVGLNSEADLVKNRIHYEFTDPQQRILAFVANATRGSRLRLFTGAVPTNNLNMTVLDSIDGSTFQAVDEWNIVSPPNMRFGGASITIAGEKNSRRPLLSLYGYAAPNEEFEIQRCFFWEEDFFDNRVGCATVGRQKALVNLTDFSVLHLWDKHAPEFRRVFFNNNNCVLEMTLWDEIHNTPTFQEETTIRVELPRPTRYFSDDEDLYCTYVRTALVGPEKTGYDPSEGPGPEDNQRPHMILFGMGSRTTPNKTPYNFYVRAWVYTTTGKQAGKQADKLWIEFAKGGPHRLDGGHGLVDPIIQRGFDGKTYLLGFASGNLSNTLGKPLTVLRELRENAPSLDDGKSRILSYPSDIFLKGADVKGRFSLYLKTQRLNPKVKLERSVEDFLGIGLVFDLLFRSLDNWQKTGFEISILSAQDEGVIFRYLPSYAHNKEFPMVEVERRGSANDKDVFQYPFEVRKTMDKPVMVILDATVVEFFVDDVSFTEYFDISSLPRKIQFASIDPELTGGVSLLEDSTVSLYGEQFGESTYNDSNSAPRGTASNQRFIRFIIAVFTVATVVFYG